MKVDKERLRKAVAVLNRIAAVELGRPVHHSRAEVHEGTWACGHKGTTSSKAKLRAMARYSCPKCGLVRKEEVKGGKFRDSQ